MLMNNLLLTGGIVDKASASIYIIVHNMIDDRYGTLTD